MAPPELRLGQPDGNLHANVGAVLFQASNGQLFIECSGVLIAPTVFLTASHCVSWIQLSMNPSTGSGGTCYGDSGGPHFLADTNTVVSLTVTGDRWCRATDVTYRLDIEPARAFLGQFLTLP